VGHQAALLQKLCVYSPVLVGVEIADSKEALRHWLLAGGEQLELVRLLENAGETFQPPSLDFFHSFLGNQLHQFGPVVAIQRFLNGDGL
jgi:hypothetical protein